MAAVQREGQRKVPVTMLSGFLGAGKTTLLRYLLTQNEERIGCIVNDVASVNIDAKLIRNDRGTKDKDAPNTTSDLADTIELANGCACCSIQDELLSSFEQLLALADQRGFTYDRFVLENSGVAEPQNLRDKFQEAALEGHPAMSRIALDNLVTVVDSGTFLKDYASRAPLAARPDLGEGGTLRPVVDLLVEQIECADHVLLNKRDQLSEAELASLRDIVKQLNPMAKVETCEQGRVPIREVFGPEAKGMVGHMNTEGQHRGAVAAAKAAAAAKPAAPDGHSHGHSHEHSHEHEGEHCAECDGSHPPGEHKHAHGHGHEGHSHAGHSHGQRQETTAAARFGIRSFVYSRRRPFHPQRLRDLVLRWLPVAQNSALEGGDAAPEGDSPIRAVLRSKGFMWMAYSHQSAFYWSHAGLHFEIRDEGDWWAAVPDSEWPTDPAARAVVLSDFDLETDMGDRRQEIVFIGAGMDQAAIAKQLDGALLSDEELAKYRERYAAEPEPEHPEVQKLRDRSKKPRI